MKIRTEEEYERAMRELASLEGAGPDDDGEARRQELESAIAAYASRTGRPATSKARPPISGEPGHEDP